MFVVFAIIINLSLWEFLRQPTGFLPTEDQGYAILLSRLPEGASQPRSREVTEKITAILRKTPGVAFWVSIGGLSVLDGANVSNISTTFIVYEDWKERGTALDQDKIISSINRELAAIQEAQAFVVIPPPIRGWARREASRWWSKIEGDFQPRTSRTSPTNSPGRERRAGLRGVTTTFSASSPQLYLDIDRTKAESLQVPLNTVFETLQAYLGFVLCQSVQQVQPGLSGVHPGFRALSSAAKGHQ